MAFLVFAGISSAAVITQEKTFDIEAQDLSKALIQFSGQSGLVLVIPTDIVKGKKSVRVRGYMVPAEALRRLLAGSGLSGEINSEGILSIVPQGSDMVDEERITKQKNRGKSLSPAREQPMKGNKKRGWGILGVLASVVLGGNMVEAQEAKNIGLEEIVVTARKVSESMQDVPISIQAFTGESLSDRGLTNIAEIGNFVSNMEFDSLSPISGSSNTPNINIRGIGTTDFLLTIDPSVGVYVDGIYVARSVGGLFDLLDLEQVEVLKGPQGTLFGRNTTAGAVLLTTRKPGDETRLNLEVATGTDSRIDFRVNASARLSDSLSAGVAFSAKRQDGYGQRRDFFADNPHLTTLAAAIAAVTVYDEPTGALLSGNATGLAPGSLVAGGITAQPPADEQPGNTDTDSARLSLYWQASESISASLAVDYTNTEETSPTLTLLEIFYTDPTAGGAPNIAGLHGLFGFDAATVPYDERFIIGDNYSTYSTGPGFNDSETFGVSLIVDVDFSESLSFKSLSAYRDLDALFGQDPDHSPFVLDAHTNDFTHEQISQEFQLIGSGDRLNWVVGGYYFEEEGVDRVIVPLLHGLAALDERNEIDNRAWALFGQATYDLLDSTSLTAGLRYTDEKKDYDQVHLDCGIANALGVPPGFVVNNCNSLSSGVASESFSNITYNVSLSHRFSDGFMLYGSYATGFKSGGFTGRTVAFIPDQTPIPFNEEEAATIEVGVKTDFWSNRVRLNAALFRTDYEDLQLVIQSGVAPITANAGEATIKGAELDVTALLSENFNVTAALGLLDGDYDEKPDQVGEHLINTPEATIGVGLDYSVPLSGGSSLTFRGDYTYKSRIYNNSENTAVLVQPSINLLDASVSWISAGERLRVTLGGKNITDKEYLITGFYQPGVGYTEGIFARPAQWYLSFKYEY